MGSQVATIDTNESQKEPGYMKAIVQDTYGGTDVLKLRDIGKPIVGDDDILVKVHAAGVDAGVWHVMAGLPYMIRIAGFGLRAPKQPIRGVDLSGQVEAVGKNISQFKPGDDVYGTANGTYAEYAVTTGEKLSLKPTNLSYEQAAAVPTSALTALQAVRNQANVKPGQKVLVVGASGGVGSFAVQIAKAMGAKVTGVASTPKLDMLHTIGVDHVIDYRREDFTRQSERYDIIVDTGGLRSVASMREVLTVNGTLVIVGGEGGGKWTGGAGRGLLAIALSPFVKHNLRNFIANSNKEDLLTLKTLIEAGEITPVVDQTFSLVETPKAIRYLKDGKVKGKIVISVRNL